MVSLASGEITPTGWSVSLLPCFTALYTSPSSKQLETTNIRLYCKQVTHKWLFGQKTKQTPSQMDLLEVESEKSKIKTKIKIPSKGIKNKVED